MLQGKLRLNLAFKVFNVWMSIFAVIIGVILFFIQGNNVVSFFLGIPIYAMYPYTMIVFGLFGVVTSLKSLNGLLVAFSAAGMFDMIGTLSSGYGPDTPLLVLWLIAISAPFILEKKQITGLILNPSFLGYVISVWILHPWFIQNYGEVSFEILWCMVYYIGFYHPEDFQQEFRQIIYSQKVKKHLRFLQRRARS